MKEHVQGKGSLAHAGAGGQQNQVGLVQARDGHIHIGQAGGQAGNGGVAGGKLAEPLVHVEDDAGDVLQALGGPALANGVDPLLGGLQHILGGARPLLDHGGQVPGSLGDAAEQGLVLDDGHILLHVGGGGGDLHELEDIVAGGVLIVDAVLPHVVQHGHRVDGQGKVEHGVDGLIDLPVLTEIEVLRLEGLDDLGHAPGVDEHGTQHALLGLHRVGHLPDKQFLVHGNTSISFRH